MILESPRPELAMGRQTFACPVPDKGALLDIIDDIRRHNETERSFIGPFTEEEYKLYEMRYRYRWTVEVEESELEFPCKNKWTRGDRFEDMCNLVKYRGSLWVSVVHEYGAASTMRFLWTNGKARGWVYCDHLNDGDAWVQSPLIAHTSLRNIRRKCREIWDAEASDAKANPTLINFTMTLFACAAAAFSVFYIVQFFMQK